MTESIEAKASRLLAGHQVQIRWATDQIISAAVRGDGGIHDVRWDRLRGWSCSCPHVGRECSHVLAVQGVTTRPVGAVR
jgi:hypothetical protein